MGIRLHGDLVQRMHTEREASMSSGQVVYSDVGPETPWILMWVLLLLQHIFTTIFRTTSYFIPVFDKKLFKQLRMFRVGVTIFELLRYQEWAF